VVEGGDHDGAVGREPQVAGVEAPVGDAGLPQRADGGPHRGQQLVGPAVGGELVERVRGDGVDGQERAVALGADAGHGPHVGGGHAGAVGDEGGQGLVLDAALG
jgi:hypothetical protein